MIKHQAATSELNDEFEEDGLGIGGDQGQKSTLVSNPDANSEFNDLEEELKNFSITINGDLKPKTGLSSAPLPPVQSQGFARDHLER